MLQRFSLREQKARRRLKQTDQQTETADQGEFVPHLLTVCWAKARMSCAQTRETKTSKTMTVPPDVVKPLLTIRAMAWQLLENGQQGHILRFGRVHMGSHELQACNPIRRDAASQNMNVVKERRGTTELEAGACRRGCTYGLQKHPYSVRQRSTAERFGEAADLSPQRFSAGHLL